MGALRRTLSSDPTTHLSILRVGPPTNPEPRGLMTAIPARPPWAVIGAVSAGGALGSVLRWGVGQGMGEYAGWPWATFFVNLTGAFALGVVMVLAVELRTVVPRWRSRPPSRLFRPFWGVGVCGGDTTFSAFALEVHHLLVGGRMVLAAAYVGASVIGGVLAVVLGMIAARRLWGDARPAGAGS